MSDQNPTQKGPQQPPVTMNPTCAHCGDDPATLTTLRVQAPDGTILLIHMCANQGCRAIFGVQAIQLPQAAVNGPQSPIVGPGGGPVPEGWRQ
jgi:hypothetical protein